MMSYMMKISLFFTVIFLSSHYCSGDLDLANDFTEDIAQKGTNVLQQQERQTCYLRVKVMCTEVIQLRLMIGDVFTDRVFAGGMTHFKCIAVPCTGDGNVAGNIVVIGNNIAAKPDVLKDLSSAFTSEEQCDVASEENYVFTVTCKTDSVQMETEIDDSYDGYNHLDDVIKGVSEKTAGIQWQNYWDKPLKTHCLPSKRHGIYLVKSIYRKSRKDRRWEWNCKQVANKDYDKDYWTGYVNEFDYGLLFNCKPNYYLCGAESYHHNGAEDRRWKFRCCHNPQHFTKNCGLTGYVNVWRGYLEYKTTGANVITGVYSYHSNRREDRLWKFAYCELKFCQV